MTATGGKAPYTWTATGLPTGLTIKPGTGLISGTATSAATANVTVTVTDALKITNTVTFALTVGTPIAVINPGTRNSTAGAAIMNVALSADGGTAPYTWIVNGLPAGLAATSTGVISGAPTTATTTIVTATVVDAAGRTATSSFTWNVAGPVVLAGPGAQAVTIGVTATLKLAATGGTGDYQWTATGLPTGLSLNPASGEITGAPTAEGSWTTAVTVTDAAGGTSSTTFAWSVAPALTVINPGAQSTLVGQQAHLALTAGGGTAPHTWTVQGLPSGLAFDPVSALITGSPVSASAASTVIASVTDAAGRTDQTSFTWTIVLDTPADLTARATEMQTVELSWKPVPGATGYRIYRDGERVTTTGTSTRLWDRQLDDTTTYLYRITAIGADGLESPLSAEATATTLATREAPVNYTACRQNNTDSGCTYTTSTPADPAYPSDGGFPLTDGVHGRSAAGLAWQGRHNQSDYSFTVDLGVSRPVTELNSTWLQAQADDIQLPLTVSYSLSTDGEQFTDVALVSRPYVSMADQVRSYRAVGLNEAARFVRVTVNGSGGWTLIDEIEARGTVADIPPA
ncbi:putative Ig domain-containing protein [Couchioplanes azureus]|uniref:putative Ig domain-containing protein n=1 Tax=Couchioplanes caeruleus TaxID=56438 RepID=UPI001E32D863|nr:putative Ig domain-containing protein [Couchioplanes caeruleus]